MKNLLNLFTAILFVSLTLSNSTCNKGNQDQITDVHEFYAYASPIVGSTEANLANLNQADLVEFLNVFQPLVNEPVELSQHANEVLFKVYDAYPVQVSTLIQNETPVNMNFSTLKGVLGNPIHDLIDTVALKQKIQNSGVTGNRITEILAVL